MDTGTSSEIAVKQQHPEWLRGGGAALSKRHEQWGLAREIFEYLSLPLSPPMSFCLCTYLLARKGNSLPSCPAMVSTKDKVLTRELKNKERWVQTSTPISVVQETEESQTRRSRNKYFIFASLGIFHRTTLRVGAQRRVRSSTSGRKRNLPRQSFGSAFHSTLSLLLLKWCTFVSTYVVCFFFYFDPAGPKIHSDNARKAWSSRVCSVLNVDIVFRDKLSWALPKAFTAVVDRYLLSSVILE